ncbi:MAG: HD domain-containing phosphohydrolase [Pseudomonadota bacterium]
MNDATTASCSSINTHYLERVIDLAEERHVAATEDIFDARGLKLVAKGTRISRSLKEKLIVHKLHKSLESCIALQDGVNTNTIVLEALRLVDAYAPIGYIVAEAGRGRQSPLEVMSNIAFGNAMSMMLTLTERGGPAALSHSVMVSLLSACLAAKLGMDQKNQGNVALAGLLHDIGELYIEPAFLDPERRLMPAEWRHVIVHPRIGQMLIADLEDYPAAVARAVGEHHERFSGAGYPAQLAGRNISVPGQILSVAEMMAEMLGEADSPLERVELALRIIPNEHAYAVVSAVSSTLRQHHSAPWLPKRAAPEHADERAKILFDHIAVVVETGDKMRDMQRLNAGKPRALLDLSIQRIDAIQRAFYSTGLDSCRNEDAAQDQDIMFEAIVATREIQWRMRELARDLALHASALGADEVALFQPLISMLDAEPGPNYLARRLALRTQSAAPIDFRALAEHMPVAAPQRTLLLVDDEPNVLSALLRLLRPLGLRILTSPSAEAALAILAHNDVGVILSDHRMPGMTGVELLSQVKVLYPATVRLVLSGYADVGTVTDAIRLGAIYKFLTKPWNPDELGGILLGAFDKHERERVNPEASA